MLLLTCGVACSSEPAPSPEGPCNDCTLRELGARVGVRVGVAAAPTDEASDALLLREFDALSLEGELLWSEVHPEPDRFRFDAADRTLGFAEDHGLYLTATHFLWDQSVEFSAPPAWVRAIDDPDALRRVMREHLAAITARHGSRIDRWIAVNEPLAYLGTTLYENHYYQVLGPGYVAEAFRIADEVAPDSELWLNEILTESDPAKSDALVALATELVEQGVPIDGVGLQGHLFPAEPDLELVERTLRRLGQLGLRVALTELDAPVPPDAPNRLAVQAERLAGMVRACLAVPECDALTFWGLHDGVSWLDWLLGPGRSPLLFDAELRPKPAYDAVRAALAAGRP